MSDELRIAIGFEFRSGATRFEGFVDGAPRLYRHDASVPVHYATQALTVSPESINLGEIVASDRIFLVVYNDGPDQVQVLNSVATGSIEIGDLKAREYLQTFTVVDGTGFTAWVKSGGSAATIRTWICKVPT